MTRHQPDLITVSDWLKQISHMGRPLKSITQIWVVTRHRISTLSPQMSFRVEIKSVVAKCQLLFQATKYPGNDTVESLRVTTFKKQPQNQNTTVFPVKALQLEPLVNDHLL